MGVRDCVCIGEGGEVSREDWERMREEGGKGRGRRNEPSASGNSTTKNRNTASFKSAP